MKHYIFAIVLVLLISLNSVFAFSKVKTDKTERKVKKSKTKGDYGDGSYDSGFRCKEIQISKGKDALKTEAEGTFLPKRLELPVVESEKTGWCWKLKAAPKTTLAEVMVCEGLNCCIPFRYLASKCTYVNPTGYKYLEMTLTNDQGTNFNLKVNLPWKAIGWYINDEEGNKIANLINSKRTENVNSVKASKDGAVSACTQYNANKSLEEATSKKGADLVAEKKKLEEKNAGLKNNIETTQASLLTEQKTLDGLNKQLKELLGQLSDKDATLTSSNDQIKSISEKLKELEGQNTSNADTKAKLKKEVDDSLANFGKKEVILKKEASQRVKEIDAAKVAVLSKDENMVVSNLKTINTN